eukprot:2213691-Pleurochrysis_carterae.AAC.1
MSFALHFINMLKNVLLDSRSFPQVAGTIALGFYPILDPSKPCMFALQARRVVGMFCALAQ